MRDESYVEFVTARWGALYRTAYLLAGQPATAEDLLQTALLKAYVDWHRVVTSDVPEAYLRTIIVNTFLSGRRRRGFPLAAVDPGTEPPVASPEATLLDRLTLWQQVCQLPPRQRAVVVLRYYEDLTEREIADALGCSPGTVKSQAADALQSLRRGLREAERTTQPRSDASPARPATQARPATHEDRP